MPPYKNNNVINSYKHRSEKIRIMEDGTNMERLWFAIFDEEEMRQEIDYFLDEGSKIRAIKILMQYASDKFVTPKRKCTLREVKDAIDKYHIRLTINRKIKCLRKQIEKWCDKNGYDKMDNQREIKDNKTGEYTYKYSDWEMIDDVEGNIINDRNWYPAKATFKKMNKLWRRYELS